jgi:hypothetical protein
MSVDEDETQLERMVDKLLDIVTALHRRLDTVERSMRPDSERFMPDDALAL